MLSRRTIVLTSALLLIASAALAHDLFLKLERISSGPTPACASRC